MAEFADVMRQWVRVRKATASSAEENVLSVYPLEEYDDALIADIEKNVMQWAAEHPEPVYPTWYEYLEKVFDPEVTKYPDDAEAFFYAACTNRIKADTAQKLGIEPKEGNK